MVGLRKETHRQKFLEKQLLGMKIQTERDDFIKKIEARMIKLKAEIKKELKKELTTPLHTP